MDIIQILMGVYHGEAFLDAQVHSIRAQSDTAWRLLVSDDSTDGRSGDVLDRHLQDTPQPIEQRKGPQAGFARNYLHLLRHAAPGYVAFSDQDDVWLPNKLARARAALSAYPGTHPTLYCARVQPWDGAEHTGPARPPLRRQIGFANALVENVAIGNTVVLNPAASALARRMALQTDDIFAHDWWLYQLVTGAGGTVVYDTGPPVVLYRQHAGNVIGAGVGLAAQVKRKHAVLRGALRDRLDLNAAALARARDALTDGNSALFDRFEAARAKRGAARLAALALAGVYRQHPLSTLGFFGAAALGRV